MSDPSRKTINIDLDQFKFKQNNTRKTRGRGRAPKPPGKDAPKIRVKNPGNRTKQTSTLKRNLLKMFRNHYDQKMGNETTPTVKIEEQPLHVPKGDFESSLDYFKELDHITKENEAKPVIKPKPVNPHNVTLRAQPPAVSPHIQNLPMPPVFNANTLPNPPIGQAPVLLKAPVFIPQYGCLKNGNLPTFRTWKHATQKNLPNVQNIPKPSRESMINMENVPSQKYEETIDKRLNEMSIRDQWKNKMKRPFTKDKPKKQRRIIRRTFHVGRSKQHPRVSVLVSNRTIRNQANLRKSELKQVPIQEVKKYLLKQGFIKVGTTTPIDVLRQMYESASMVCGEVKNHNPENLLYNYFNQSLENEMI
jgi:hypothetical protein